jgi:hypothetical protein
MIGNSGRGELSTRLLRYAQVSSTQSLSNFPAYLDAFLAHLRLLVGVPFHYLVPDPRLLPVESIRFFYLDRSWTDRLVDGALAVGKVGTREVAHVQEHAASVQQSLDDSESLVRDLQRRRIDDYPAAKQNPKRQRVAGDVVTGFVLRSALVAGWPHLEARAYAAGTMLTALRFERLSRSVLIVLWRGVPDRVEIEEPHHGVQFGLNPEANGTYSIFLRKPDGTQIMTGNAPVSVPVPMRQGTRGVVHVSELRRRLEDQRVNHFPAAIAQTGSAAFGVSVLDPPWLQRFSNAPESTGPVFQVSGRVVDQAFVNRLRTYVGEANG